MLAKLRLIKGRRFVHHRGETFGLLLVPLVLGLALRVVRWKLHPGLLRKVARHLDRQGLGEGVDHRSPDAMQASGGLVVLPLELAARVEAGQHHLEGRLALGLVHVHGDAAAVVGDLDDVAGLDDHRDGVAVAAHGLVDGVVHHLVDQVVKPSSSQGSSNSLVATRAYQNW